MADLSVLVETDPDMWGDGTFAVFFTMLIDGDRIDDASIDPDVFFTALNHDGRHPLMTCPTGEFACCGAWVETEVRADGWTIDIEHRGAAVNLSWSSVIETGTRIIDTIQQARGDQGIDPFVPSRISSVSARMPWFREQLAQASAAIDA